MKYSDKKVNNLIEVITEYKTATVITGAKITFSMEDARAMYNVTTFPLPKKEEQHDVQISKEFYADLMTSREILRSIAKAVLIQSGESTVISSLVSSLNKMNRETKDVISGSKYEDVI